MNITLPPSLKPIIDVLIAHDIRPVLVGGYLRDIFISQSISKDIDIELYNVNSIEQLNSILETFAKPYEVGKNFGVIKLNFNSYDIDFSLPRTENKTAKGHRGFDITTYKEIGFKEAALRRDFTINSMGYDLLNNTLLDPYNALEDIENKILTYVDKKSFIQDPLRVFRAISFTARFNLTCKDELITLCKTMYPSLKELAKERVFQEIKKLLLLSKKPSIGFRLLQKMDSLKYFPSLYLLKDVEYNSTLQMLDDLAKKSVEDESLKLRLMFALLVLCFKDEASVITFIISLNDDKKFLQSILSLYRAYKILNDFKIDDYNIQKLALHVKIDELAMLCSVNLNIEVQNMTKDILNRAKALHVSHKAPEMILKGQNLIDIGLNPSKEFSKLLNQAFEAQLKGEFTTLEEAKQWLINN